VLSLVESDSLIENEEKCEKERIDKQSLNWKNKLLVDKVETKKKKKKESSMFYAYSY